MSSKVINLYKKCGQTPLECINELKNSDSSLSSLPVTYAGRLDPLAEGVLLALVGDECHKKDEYLSLSKEYELTILFGFETDTYDLMGQIIKESKLENFNIEKKIVEGKLLNFIGIINQPYPPYSSRTVKGKPLYKWTREGKIDEIEIPSHRVKIEFIKIIKMGEISTEVLHRKIKKIISLVKGDFRQESILELWEKSLKERKGEKFKTITLKVSCGSGVYMRSLAHELGKSMGISALALKIIRTKVGEYSI